MTAVVERPASDGTGGTGGMSRSARAVRPPAALMSLPQVNLLPPEVRAARALRILRRWLAVVLVVALLAISATYLAATRSRAAADERLSAANATTLDLQAAQRRYAQVPAVLAATQAATQARQAGTATEILWKPYTDAITAVLPADVSFDSFAMTGPSPLDATVAASTDPLAGGSIGSITFSGRSKTVPDTAAWLDALASVPGLSNPWASSVTASEDNGSVFYTVSLSVQLTDKALAHRFDTKAAS